MKKMFLLMMTAMMSALPMMAQMGPVRHGGSPVRQGSPVRHGAPVRSVPTPAPPRYAPFSHSYHSSSYYNNDVYWGLRAGLNVSTVSSADRYLDGGTAKAGLSLGMVVGMQVDSSVPLCFETGIYYNEKGGKGNYQGNSFTYNLNYLELPLVLKYRYEVDSDVSVQPFFGGYVAAGVSGKIKNFGERQAYSSFDDDAFKRTDGGLRLGCGLQLSNLYAEVGYDIGLANVSHDYFDTSHTGSFFATIGVNL